MCCLFGFYNYSGEKIDAINDLTNALAVEATVRGTDATGIAFNDKNKLLIHKEGKSAFEMKLKHPGNAVCVTGHTRHATQGNKKNNFNNHPFFGKARNANFALCHNGVLSNDATLRKKHHLPKHKIETDSYIAVQLLEHKKYLNADSIKWMAEQLEGSFAFSILDTQNTLWLVRGDSPLALLHIPEYKLYVYASTKEILYKGIVDTKLFDMVKQGKTEEIKVHSGDILNILPDGTIIHSKFDYTDYSYYGCYRWWHYTTDNTENAHIEDVKTVAKYYGYSPDVVDELLNEGFSLHEVEDYIYCLE